MRSVFTGGFMEISVDDLTGPEIGAFLTEHIEDMRSVSPPESKHALDLDSLRAPDITFWSVTDAGMIVGCGALKRLDGTHAELKSMRTASAAKRRGIASMLLGHIISEATSMGFARLLLETGSAPFFEPARKLYIKFGFQYCAPFSHYIHDPNSVFMEKALTS
jgi:putative acetyltransferase